MHMHHDSEPGGAHRREALRRAMSRGGARLHEIDSDDVGLTRRGLDLVSAAARMLLCGAQPGLADVPLTRGQGLALFLDHLFWEEDGGRLILCADLPGRSFCLPIPPQHWRVLPPAGPVH